MNRAIRSERRHQELLARQRSLVVVLAALEEIQSLRAPFYREDAEALDERNDALRIASGRYQALLRACVEPLPLARADAFSHFGYQPPTTPPPLVGNPEAESEEAIAVRGELVAAIDRLRKQIESRRRGRR